MDIEAPYRHYGPPLLAYLYSRLPRAVAEDIHHDVWIAALKHPTPLAGDDLRRWLFRVARNAMLDYLDKASTRRERTGIEGDSPATRTAGPDAMEKEELVAALRACIEALPELFRVVVQGRLRGERPEEMATQYKVSRATVDTRFHRARELLERCLGANQS